MDLNTLISLIGSLGYPMAISIYLIWAKRKTDDKTNEILTNFSLNLQENTIILKQINEMLKEMKETK